jgi:hypothetical protein
MVRRGKAMSSEMRGSMVCIQFDAADTALPVQVGRKTEYVSFSKIRENLPQEEKLIETKLKRTTRQTTLQSYHWECCSWLALALFISPFDIFMLRLLRSPRPSCPLFFLIEYTENI